MNHTKYWKTNITKIWGNDLWRWLFLLSGIYGSICLLRSIDGIRWNHLRAYLTEILLLLLLNICYWLGKSRKQYFAAVLTAAAGAVLFARSMDNCRGQVRTLFSSVMRSSQGGYRDVTEAVILLAVILTVGIFVFEFLVKVHWPIYLCVTGIVLSSVFVGIPWNMDTIFFVTIFQFSFWMLHTLKRTDGSLSVQTFGRFAAVCLTLVFFIAAVLVYWKSDWLYQAAYQAEGAVRRNVRRMTGTSENLSDGVINRGNIYPSGIEQMELTVSQEPSESVYLKNFSGGTYAGGQWERADDNAVFRRMNKNSLHWSQWTSWISGMYESLYFVMNKNMEDHTQQEERELLIRYQKEAARKGYRTYFSSQGKESEASEDYEEYRVEYFEQNEMNIRWDNVSERFELIRDWYYMIQEAYAKEAEAVYTEVTDAKIPRLTDLCRDNPLDDPRQITEFIQNYLEENVSYTQTPGMIPFNEDSIEYFLFEKGEGYCQHFASAAVLMYRLYGIPARYAAGYRLSPSDFKRQEDGNWYVAVTDQFAHAWPEIFIEDYGWIPVEVTPAAGTNVGIVHEASKQQEEDADRTEPDHPAAEPLDEGEPDRGTISEENEKTQTKDVKISWQDRNIFIWSAGILLLSAVIWTLIWNCRLKREWMKRGGCRRIYRQLIRLIHFRGYLKDYDGSEKEFPGKLAEAFPVITPTEARRLLDDVNEEVFGKDAFVNSRNVSFAQEMYERIWSDNRKIRRQ